MADKEEAAAQTVASTRPEPPPDGLVEFYRRSYRPLVVAVMAMGASWGDAEEAVSEVMKEILEKKQWGSLRSPFTWIRKAALHRYIDQLRRDRQAPFKAIRGGQVLQESCSDAHLNTWEDTQWIEQLLATLPPAQREVVVLNLRQLSPGEMAEMLGKKKSTISQNLALARARLKPMLNDDYRVPDTLNPEASTRKEDAG